MTLKIRYIVIRVRLDLKLWKNVGERPIFVECKDKQQTPLMGSLVRSWLLFGAFPDVAAEVMPSVCASGDLDNFALDLPASLCLQRLPLPACFTGVRWEQRHGE